MTRDIETRADLDKLLREFYAAAMRDDQIGHHFAFLDLENHLPVITDFWEKVLFGAPVYFGNPLAIHKALHAKAPLKFEHFVRWVEIFSATVNKLYAGKTADAAKLRAKMIAGGLNENLNAASAGHTAPPAD